MSELGPPPIEGAPAAPEPAAQELPARNFQELRDLEASATARLEFDKAAESGDWETANQRYQVMQQQGITATLQTLSEGGDPARETRPIGRFLVGEIEMARRHMAMQDRVFQLNTFMQEDPELNEVRGYMQGVYQEYRDMHEAKLGGWQPNLMTPEQRWDYMAKLQPVRRDPNEVAEFRSKMVSVSNRMGQIDPSFNLWTDPRTKGWANWMNREAGVTGLGYLQSGEQQLELGFVGRAAYATAEGIEAATDPLLSAGYQIWEWTDQGMRGMGLPSISPPTNYIEGPNGEVFFNQERPHPGFLEAAIGLWSTAAGQNVAQNVAGLNRSRMLEQAQRSGFDLILHGTSRVAGTFLGFGLPAGAAIRLGSSAMSGAATKGMSWLGGLGVKGAESARALAIIQTWAKPFGAAQGLAAFQTTAFGKQQGYLNQYLTGLAMYPALAIMGKYGDKLERALVAKKMPPKLAGMLSEGMTMGVPFATLEMAEMGLWPHLRNPNESTLTTYLKNIFGAMLFKGTFGRTPMTMQQEAAVRMRFQVKRTTARAAWAEDIAMGRAEGTPEGTPELEALGKIILRKKAAEDPGERRAIEEEQFAFEKELDVKEFGLESEIEAEMQKGPEEMPGPEVSVRPEPEFVEGKEPEPIRPQERRQEAERRQKREEERIDPLEEPDFMERPALERRLIQEAPDAATRKRIAAELDAGGERYVIEPEESGQWRVLDTRTGERVMTGLSDFGQAKRWAGQRTVEDVTKRGGVERRKVERRKPEDVEALEELRMASEREPGEREHRRVPTAEEQRRGAEAGPGSMQAPPTMKLEAEPGAPKQALMEDIFLEMEGRPERPGIRVPFTAVRVGGRPGDPVRPAMRKGFITGKSARGVFKLFENLIRTKAGSLVVYRSHEWSHAMQRSLLRAGGGKAFIDAVKKSVTELPQEALNEFPKILEGYGGWENLAPWHRFMEVHAEWHARDLLGDATLYKEVPALTKFFREQLTAKENAAIREQYLRVKKAIKAWSDVGWEGRLEASIKFAGEIASETQRATQPTKYEKARDSVLRQMFDDIITLKRSTEKYLEATGRDPMDLDIMEDTPRLWDTLRLVAPKTVEHLVMRGYKLPDGTRVPGLREVVGSVKGKERDFTKYLVAVLNAQRIKRGFTATLPMADYVKGIEVLQRENPEFRQAARQLKAWTDVVVDIVGETGNLSRESVERIKNAYVLWVPMIRLMEGAAEHGVGRGGRRIMPAGEAVKHVRGGEERIQDPLMAMFDVMTEMISSAHRTMLSSSLYMMAKGQEAGGLASVVPKKRLPKEFPLRDVLNAMEKGVDFADEQHFFFQDMVSALREANALDPQTVTLFAQKNLPIGEPNIVAFTPRLTEAQIVRTARGDKVLEKIIRGEQGKNLWLQIDPAVYETVMGLDMPSVSQWFNTNLLGRALRGSARTVRFFATGIRAPFTLANAWRDMLTYPMFTQTGEFAPHEGFVAFIKGASLYHTKNSNFRELYDLMGVRMSSLLHHGTRQKMLGQARNFIERGRSWAERLEDFMGAPENYLRIHEFRRAYEAAKEAGKSEQEARLRAAEAGREITVNFARGGIFAKLYNPMAPYFNATFQGQRKLFRQIALGGDGKNDAQRARIQRASVLNGLFNITMPTVLLWAMNHEEEWYQDMPQWRKLFFFNMKITDDFILTLPKPFDAGVLFGAVPEALLEAGFNEKGVKPNAWDLAGGLFPYLKGPWDFLPALIKPGIEIGTGWDLWRNRPLTPQWIADNRIRKEQATLYTSESAKIISSAINGILTPIQIEKLMGGYTAGMGTWGLQLMDEVTQMKNHPGFSMSPFNRFITAPHRTGHFVNELYEISRELDRKAGSKTATSAELELRRQINAAKSRMADLRKAADSGAITREEAERRRFQVARPLVERFDVMGR